MNTGSVVYATRKDPRNRRAQFLVFGSPLIGAEEIEEVVATLKSGWIGKGPRVAEFEEMMALYTGAKHAIAVSSCTAALHLSLLALGIGDGDEVITTPMTFAATANAILHAGARPVFADVDLATMLIEPREIERAITPRTKAIVPVHLAGRPCRMDEIGAIARKHGLYIIEDAAHCIEGEYKSRHVGSIGDLTCFSFYVTKNVTTVEGGMVTTSNKKWAEKIRVLAMHGMDQDAFRRFQGAEYKHYEVVAPGYKYNMTDFQAALGVHQLRRVESCLRRREEIWNYYASAFFDLPVRLPARDEARTRHARHLYTLLVHEPDCGKSRDEVLAGLMQRNIGVGVHYRPVHLHPYYRQTFGFKPGAYPNSEWIGERTVSLPLSARLSNEDVDDVVEAVRDTLAA
ncbi:MAG: DegT/DnrJ/EryC1/StrS aminotransferase family protein [Acidobacteriaceae bacterium]|nr:DegT/DnrJ/EryC1/StrS aminotransferase family protein [Acidobacteriaceae bacterium]